ncbi:FGGY-family carbohydrate kinase [Gaoshiqia sediminis]|uniref:FGGY family carbohydrate kinase n=1 Tax=Gaoshiqia sediminis TaxID=2986998 RepID=A0AA42C831_9BACT|nr:FGGY family carbohydrate kinase [Gaoshiqia sediminis]MCW0482266.1 FGGY family carbohydrate kinase [Gaoshiqia sediminis]
MKKVIAVFDIGKTNKKLLLFDENMQVVFQQEQKFPVISDEDGFECDDIDLITAWIEQELSALVAGNNYGLIAANFSTYGASLMFLDKDGERLTPVYNYLKQVPEAIAEDLFSRYGGKDEFCRRTASPALGLLLNSGIQILWLKLEKADVFDKARSILHFPQYLSYSLCGKVVSEPTSIGCHTFMWDYDNMAYHPWIKDQNIELPQPVTNDVVFESEIRGKKVLVGTGIHDSSASLVPYLKGSDEPFILLSTGTWCITMNPFNSEPLTADQLEQDCLCFLSPDKQQVKSSRLFMGHFHEVWAEKLARHFQVETGRFKTVSYDEGLVNSLAQQPSVFFPNGKESFEEGLKSVDLSVFTSYEEAYTKLVMELTELCIRSIQLVIPQKDVTQNLYISGGFARNEIFIRLLAKHFSDKKVYTSEIDNASALGAALVIAGTIGRKNLSQLDLGLKRWSE